MIGMIDYPNFVMVDPLTSTPSLLPIPNSPHYAAGPAVDSISLINPMPTPTNSTIKMAEVKTKKAQWTKPSYPYTRTIKRAESLTTNYAMLGAVVLVIVGVFGLSRLIKTDYDKDVLTVTS